MVEGLGPYCFTVFLISAFVNIYHDLDRRDIQLGFNQLPSLRVTFKWGPFYFYLRVLFSLYFERKFGVLLLNEGTVFLVLLYLITDPLTIIPGDINIFSALTSFLNSIQVIVLVTRLCIPYSSGLNRNRISVFSLR